MNKEQLQSIQERVRDHKLPTKGKDITKIQE